MTQMQSPYQDDQTSAQLYHEPDRTSLMAIFSLIFGVGGCCLGITSIPAILLGAFSLVGISKSNGRVGGAGFGIAGILTGLLTLALWGGAIGAINFGIKGSMVPMSEGTASVLLDVQSDQFDSARAIFTGEGALVSDEQAVLFRQSYQGTLGDFVSAPVGFGEWIAGYGETIQQMEQFNGRNDLVPLPMRFDAGWGLVLYVMEPKPSGVPLPIDLIVLDGDGNVYSWSGAGIQQSSVGSGLPDTPDVPVDIDPVDDSADDGP